MAYTVSNLISGAYNLSGIVSRDFEQISAPQLDLGLESLNDLLGEATAESGLIPYYKQYDFVSIAGQEVYFIPNLIEIDTFVFFIDQVRYATLGNQRQNYFGSPRAENILSLPFNWHMERTFIPGAGPGPVGAGVNLYVYFKPNQAYPMTIWGLFGLAAANFNDDLSLIYDRFYISYLRYALAERICDDYSYIVPNNITDRLAMMKASISKSSAEMDLTQNTISTVGEDNGGMNYGQVNLGHGWSV